MLEGFARKCLVVAAKLRTFGYDIKDGEEAYIPDEPAIFAMRCLELMKPPQVAERMADRAYRRFLKGWTWDSYGPYGQLLSLQLGEDPLMDQYSQGSIIKTP